MSARPTYSTLGLLLTLYIAQGLPSGFITQALPVIMRKYDASLVLISWAGLLLVPAALKFAWAPVLDRWYSVRWGQGRSWILPLQITSAFLVMGIGWLDPTSLGSLTTAIPFFMIIMLVAWMGATHDIAADGLATRVLGSHERGEGNAMQVVGYRVGIILGGGVVLMLLSQVGWRWLFISIGLLILLNTIPIARYREPQWPHQQTARVPKTRRHWRVWLQEEFGYFWHTPVLKAWLVVLLVFKIADALSSGMVRVMMFDMGLGEARIGLWGSIAGSAGSVLGALLGAWALRHISRAQALLYFNGLQAITTGLYALAAWQYEQKQYWFSPEQIFWFNALEHVAASMALVSILAVVMDQARPAHAGSDFTFQVCLMTLLSGGAHLVAGNLAEVLGYSRHFLLSGVVGLFCLIPIWIWHRQVQAATPKPA